MVIVWLLPHVAWSKTAKTMTLTFLYNRSVWDILLISSLMTELDLILSGSANVLLLSFASNSSTHCSALSNPKIISFSWSSFYSLIPFSMSSFDFLALWRVTFAVHGFNSFLHSFIPPSAQTQWCCKGTTRGLNYHEFSLCFYTKCSWWDCQNCNMNMPHW